MEMFASGTAAPEGSCKSPESVAPAACAKAGTLQTVVAKPTTNSALKSQAIVDRLCCPVTWPNRSSFLMIHPFLTNLHNVDAPSRYVSFVYFQFARPLRGGRDHAEQAVGILIWSCSKEKFAGGAVCTAALSEIQSP